MKKLNVVELKEMLLNKDISFLELDNMMSNNGYYTVSDDGVTKDIKNDLTVAYTATDSNEAEILISFEITIDNGEDEIEESFYLKVLDISEL